jgi:hypothetical protein
MFGPLVLLLAGSALDLGTSPLAEKGHAHRWTEIQNDEEGTGWVDEAWRSEAVVDGRPLKLLLIRGDIIIKDPMQIDMIMAVDCQRDLLGIKEGWVHKASFGNNFRLPLDVLTMDFADKPPTETEQKIIDFACEGRPLK